MIRKLESLEVKDGKIILKVRAKASRVQRFDGRQEGSPRRGCGSPEERGARRANRRKRTRRRKYEAPTPKVVVDRIRS